MAMFSTVVADMKSFVSTRHPEIDRTAEWEVVARFRPAWWRGLTSRTNLGYRLVRDGFHALTILHSQTSGERDDVMMVGAVPGAIGNVEPR